MTRDPVREIADAVLYEGYILWPYRRSALKNRRRFTFGGVYPPAHSAAHPDDPESLQTQVLLRAGEDARVQVGVRFLQIVRRAVARGAGDRLVEVDELTVDGERHLSWDEATEREVAACDRVLGDLRAGCTAPIEISAGRAREDLTDSSGAAVGALVRSWRTLRGQVRVDAQPVGEELWRLTVRIINTTPFHGDSRQLACEQAFCSTHTMLSAAPGAFVSATDPPPQLADAVAACRNTGTWPVLVGESGECSTMLSSPIILEDHPRVAPESPGDLFDGGEIDQLLTLNILALTDEEKDEMAASDPRAAVILRRTEALTPDELMALHGTVREWGMARP